MNMRDMMMRKGSTIIAMYLPIAVGAGGGEGGQHGATWGAWDNMDQGHAWGD